ncbi:hypothetical protein Cgig2_017921 [Carnegiea gigantea]|uniref:Uncharacterized protein n=1 Tax=Carnegiea gigantea TaxID=171969 RepID=A0A9Q1K732_9CARY|nr:hypothetical protein Cgig2_017921 [Carnegiea gigantea]
MLFLSKSCFVPFSPFPEVSSICTMGAICGYIDSNNSLPPAVHTSHGPYPPPPNYTYYPYCPSMWSAGGGSSQNAPPYYPLSANDSSEASNSTLRGHFGADNDSNNNELEGIIHPIERKAAKRKAKEKANNTLDDLLIDYSSMLATVSTGKVQFFRNVVARVKKKAVIAQQANVLADVTLKYKRAKELQMRQHKFREKLHKFRESLYDDKILMMKFTTLPSGNAA